jgi:DNA-binding transcriptional LysR family regulator
MTTNLPIELLRSFVAIAEFGTMMRASERICVTQSALSLQMKRLGEIVQTPLFERHNRGLLLTPTGEALLVYARGILDLNDRAVSSMSLESLAGPVRLGIVQDFAAPLISDVLVRFLQQYPETRLQVKVATTSNLSALFSAGLLEIMLGIGEPDDGGAVHSAQMAWCGHTTLVKNAELPLAIMEAPCRFRDAALATLDKAGWRYRIVLETPSIAILKAAVDGGLAVTCRTLSFLGGTKPAFEIPDVPLPRVGYLMRKTTTPNPLVLRLSALLRNAMANPNISPT